MDRPAQKSISGAYAVFPSKFGRIIGPGGKTIAGLRERFGVNIRVPQRGDDSTAITIEGEADM